MGGRVSHVLIARVTQWVGLLQAGMWWHDVGVCIRWVYAAGTTGVGWGMLERADVFTYTHVCECVTAGERPVSWEGVWGGLVG